MNKQESTAELPREAWSRARAVVTFGDVSLTPRPLPRRPSFKIGPGLILVFAGAMWLATVLFAGWTISWLRGC